MTLKSYLSCEKLRRRSVMWDYSLSAMMALVMLIFSSISATAASMDTPVAFAGLFPLLESFPIRQARQSRTSTGSEIGSVSNVHRGWSRMSTFCRQTEKDVSDERNLSHSIRMEEQINLGLERAKLVLQKSRAKLAALAEEQASSTAGVVSSVDVISNLTPASPVPFFARAVNAPIVATAPSSRESLVKTVNDETGLITIDGDKMAAQSEREEWEFRPLSQVFSTATTTTEEGTLETSPSARIPASSPQQQRLADRDVLASIYNLRMLLQQDDYQKIFDVKNRFIGDDN